MTTVTQTPTTRKPILYYGWLRDEHGIFLQHHGVVSFLDDLTETWHEVDLPTLTTWAVLNGRVEVADHQQYLDGDRVRRCSRTLVTVEGR